MKNGKKLRTGFTTGSCAAAAAKAAVYMLFNDRILEQVEIDTPKGWKLKLDVNDPVITEEYATCYIIKDAGDDPDITDGIHVYAKVRKVITKEIKIISGKGIGIVTMPGLQVKPGSPAINPIPMVMIKKEVSEVLPKGTGIEIELSIPAGEELAKKTFNPRLGIVGGLSILGTTGIVEPMSEDAIKDTLALELNYKKEVGLSSIVLVPGNYGEVFSKTWLNIKEDKIVKISNYLGFALEKCSELGFKRVILAGHIGKLVKPAGGIFYTHSRVSDTRMEILVAYLGIMGCPQHKLVQIMECRTTEEAIQIIESEDFEDIYITLVDKCALRCEEYVFGSLSIGVAMFSMKKLLAKSNKVDSIMEVLAHE
ncbi:cobalamin biosynthesis protein CbiD [Serpentinicella alkaliphila]|nr:cobalamin biosynthesis protein CbiD [Serpentinicella alkaliphila]